MRNKRFVSGWGGVSSAKVLHIERRIPKFVELSELGLKFSVLGSCTSYGDSAISDLGNYFSTERLKDIEIDPENRLARCSGGVTYEELLKASLPFSLIPKVIPGTDQATIGGSIAADVHGKSTTIPNCISNGLLELKLLGTNGVVNLSTTNSEDSDIIRATVGGLGITGLILSAVVPLQKVDSEFVLETRTKCRSLHSTLRVIEKLAKESDYMVCWVDLSRKRSFRAIVSSAQISPYDSQVSLSKVKIFSHLVKRLAEIELNPRILRGPFLIFRWNLAIANLVLYYTSKKKRVVSLQEILFPMKKLLLWRWLHGRGGLIQWQRIFPFESEAVMEDILNRIQSSRYLPTLVTIKISQEFSSSVLGFCLPGWNLAIDFRANQRGLRKFLQELDLLVLRAGGRPYLIKDDYISREVFELFYPESAQLKRTASTDFRPNWISNNQLKRLGLLD
jgi:hypothetical protein